MPYADPEKRRKVKRESERRRRAAAGTGLAALATPPTPPLTPGELPEPPTRDSLLRALGIQALEGNVPAIRLLLEEYRRDGDADEKPKRSAIDELAARRARGA